MNQPWSLSLLVAVVWLSALSAQPADPVRGETEPQHLLALGTLSTGAQVVAFQNPAGDWGIQVMETGRTLLRQESPIQVSLYNEGGKLRDQVRGYQTFQAGARGFTGLGEIQAQPGVCFRFEDHWNLEGNVLQFERTVRVVGNAPEGFSSALLFETKDTCAWSSVKLFVPALTYGSAEHLVERAPCGIANILSGRIELREDQMVAPLWGMYFGDGSSVALVDPCPRGDTTVADVTSFTPKPVISDRFLFGGLGGREIEGGGVEFGFWFPGTCGQFKARDQGLKPARRATSPVQRTHPIRDGFTQAYQLRFRFGAREQFHEFYRHAWRWAWATLKPSIHPQDIETVRRTLTDMLGEQVETVGGRTGIRNFVNWPPLRRNGFAIMGFTGRNLEAAVLLLMEAERGKSPQDAQHRQLALAIIDTFLQLKVAPPEGEGFDLLTGHPEIAIPRNRGEPPMVYLRSFTDDMKMLLRGFAFERAHGRQHPEWLKWCVEFGDWLLAQQLPTGAFPRSWVPGTGVVSISSPQSSYNAVPLLVLLAELTGDSKYLTGAVRAAEFCWVTEQSDDHFVGGAIDNPNIQDKEAASLSMEAYLALYEKTREVKWLRRAEAAADNVETYLYIWNVPLPPDADDSKLNFKRNVSTLGISPVSTSSSCSGDEYLAYNVDEFAKLYKHTEDIHYLEVAKFLLHNTKSMLALPGRTFDLPGPGWQTEGFAFRGVLRDALWLPWVSTSHLNGIVFAEAFDQQLFNKLLLPGP